MRILLFDSVHRVMLAEKRLVSAGVPHELLPTPKEYSTECGMCIGVQPAQAERAMEILGRTVCIAVDVPDQETS